MSSGWRIATAGSDPHAIVYIGLGSNLGDRLASLRAALREIAGLGAVEAVSAVYESEPVGSPDQPDFWNLVVRLRTAVPPLELLHRLKTSEHRLGRRPTFRYGPRSIDLDILLYGEVVLSTATLELPHPRLLERGFVLRPLAELDPTLTHPLTGERIVDRLARGSFERAVPLFAGTVLLPDNDRGDVQDD